MSNALVKQQPSRTALAQQSAGDPFAIAAAEMAGSSAIYMKFNGNSGEFSVGTTGDEVPEGTRLATDMVGFRQGWICWKDSEVVDEIMATVSSGQRPPAENELTDHGPYIQNEEQNDGWNQQAAVVFRNLKTGEEYTFKSSSKSAYRGLGNLLKDYARQYKIHPNEVPIVELSSKQFEVKNKKWGKKYAPVFKIVDWVKEEDLSAQLDGDNEGDYDQGEAPVKEAKPAAAQVTEQKVADPAPAAEKPAEPAKAETAAATETAPAATGEKPQPQQRGARRRSF